MIKSMDRIGSRENDTLHVLDQANDIPSSHGLNFTLNLSLNCVISVIYSYIFSMRWVDVAWHGLQDD